MGVVCPCPPVRDDTVTPVDKSARYQVSDIVIEPYNAILAMSHLLTSADMIFCLDNEVGFRIEIY